MTNEEFALYVGVDWGSTSHHATVLDASQAVIGERVIEHSGRALGAFADWLAGLAAGQPHQVAVAIEVPRGPIVETLLERGFAVFAVNPKQLDRFRDRHSAAGAKDDRRDAWVLAHSLATDQPAFRPLQVDDPLVIQLRELSRIDEDLQTELARLANRLRDQLHRFFPQVLTLSPAADEPWMWALLAIAPSPDAASVLSRAAVAAILGRHRIRRVNAADVLRELSAPPVYVAPGTSEAASEHVLALLPRLQLLHEQRTHYGRRIDGVLAKLAAATEQREHRDVAILQSLPGVGRLVSATMLAEASQALAARDYHALRGHGGIAPVTKQSGKRKLVMMRYGCNQRLRRAFYHWGRISAQCDPHSRQHYGALRSRGHSHGRAVRGVVDRLLRVLVAMLTTGTLYDPAKRRTLSTAAA